MKKMGLIIIGVVLAVISTVFGGFSFATASTKPTVQNNKIDYTKRLYCEIDNNNELLTKKQYEISPPLHPERFRRRMKMLLGIDTKDYPENSKVYIGGMDAVVITLSLKTQTIDIETLADDHSPYANIIHSKDILPAFWSYIFMNDIQAKENIEEYIKSYQKNSFSGYKRYRAIDYGDENEIREEVEGTNLFIIIYQSFIFYNNEDLLDYCFNYGSGFGIMISNPGSVPVTKDIDGRYSDLRLDLINLYLNRKKQDFKFAENGFLAKKDELFIGFDPAKDNGMYVPFVSNVQTYGRRNEYHHPWQNYSAGKGISSILNFLLRLEEKYVNKSVIIYMSGQADKSLYIPEYWQKENRETIKSNDYYGYSLLRDFCEDPMREMKMLDEIGNSFMASVKEEDLLYLEPFATSYDIDSIATDEVFTAYEMGYDDYYLVGIEKPVESPIAGADGYAQILDRTEIVYGYVLKSNIKPLTDADILDSHYCKNYKNKKRGEINDPDGYVNIRSGQSTNSSIVMEIKTGEVFDYWEIGASWCVVETKNGVRGFVYKDRINEVE